MIRLLIDTSLDERQPEVWETVSALLEEQAVASITVTHDLGDEAPLAHYVGRIVGAQQIAGAGQQ
jgi:ABC-type cobalamin/Fe3+-siderophores transport system ATPase subunit